MMFGVMFQLLDKLILSSLAMGALGEDATKSPK
jgi:hypothetical protein